MGWGTGPPWPCPLFPRPWRLAPRLGGLGPQEARLLVRLHMATRGLRDQVFLFSGGAARIPSSPGIPSFSGSAGRPAIAAGGPLPGWEAAEGMWPLPSSSCSRSASSLSGGLPSCLPSVSTATGGGGGLSEPPFSVFALPLLLTPRLQVKYLFSSPFSNLYSSDAVLPSHRRTG